MSIVLAASDGYEAPGPADLLEAAVRHGQWTATWPMLLMAISVLLIAVWLLVTTRRQAIVPGRSQFYTEAGLRPRPQLASARDVIGSHDFLRFVPLLFTMFVLILLNNLFGVVPPFLIPDDEPDRLPDRPDAHRVRHVTTRSASAGTASAAT